MSEMCYFDKLFDDAAKASGIEWAFAISASDRNVRFNKRTNFPCIWRTISEKTKPLFDDRGRMQKKLSLYFVNVGFSKITAEQLNVNLDDLMDRFVRFRHYLRSYGVDVQFSEDPYPAWDNTNYDEYGIIFNVTATYTKC